MERNKPNKLVKSIEKHATSKREEAFTGNTEIMVSTGSTLLDLAISGTRKRGGGIPGGILLEAFGPPGTGKTVLLCEIGGAVQRLGGDIMFNDPEARLNTTFASLFDLNIDDVEIKEPDTVTELIDSIRAWKPNGKSKINAVLTDSLAALSTDMELESKDGDKMGMRRAKEFSEGLRKVARILKQKNYIMACSNQIRDKANAVAFTETFTTPGGQAIPFYASIRLRFHKSEKIKKKKKIGSQEVTHTIGTLGKVEVYKNSVDAPFRTAPLYIIFDYGIDDVRANLQFVKEMTGSTNYFVNDINLGTIIDRAITQCERQDLVAALKEQTIDLWEEIQKSFEHKRKTKIR